MFLFKLSTMNHRIYWDWHIYLHELLFIKVKLPYMDLMGMVNHYTKSANWGTILSQPKIAFLMDIHGILGVSSLAHKMLNS